MQKFVVSKLMLGKVRPLCGFDMCNELRNGSCSFVLFHNLPRVCVFVCVFLSFLVGCVRDAKDGAAVARLMRVVRVVAVRKRFSRVIDGSGSRVRSRIVCLRGSNGALVS